MKKFFLLPFVLCLVLCSCTSCLQSDNDDLLAKIEYLEEQLSEYEYEISELNRINELKRDDLNVEIDMLIAERVDLTDKLAFVDNSTNIYHHYYHAQDIYDLSVEDTKDEYTIIELQKAKSSTRHTLCGKCKTYYE